MKPASLLAAILLLLVAALHLLRLVLRVPVTIGATAVPLWVSIVAVIVPTLLAVALLRERRR